MGNEYFSSSPRDAMIEREIVDRVMVLLREEWEYGNSGMPGFHHQPAATTAAEIAARIFK
jgi:hypothetical protein